MTEYLLQGGKSVSLQPSDAVGKGGEADIFRKGGEAFKIFKPPSHADLAGSPDLQREARERIAMHQQKLPALMAIAPQLPKKISAPAELVYDKAGKVAGYRMNFVDNAEVMLRYGERSFREQGISDEMIRDIFMGLYPTIDGGHTAGFVFADFNDLNVLIKGIESFVIDADSGQFGQFISPMFTTSFVDPLICDPHASSLMMVRPHSPETDWYAYLIMLMRSLLYVGPYGGVYRPVDKTKQISHDARPLKRITVFDPEVRYPKPARHFKILPDDLLGLFEQTFVKDKRGKPPISVIESLRFTTCTKCGVVHARGQCPECVGITPAMVKEVHVGTAKGIKVFDSSGPILYASMQGGVLRYLYHHNGAYRREGDRVVVQAQLDPNIRFRIRGDDTVVARGNRCLVFVKDSKVPTTISVESYGLLPLVDANKDHIFFADGGGLYRTTNLGLDYREKVGDILPNQTLFWVGEELGFGFYRAAELSNFFMFRSKVRGLNDSVTLPGIRGQLVDATCCFGHDRIWFFTTTQEGNTAFNRCYLLDAQGKLLASAEARPGDGSWLEKIRGACAARDFLLVPTDDGVVRVAQNGSALGVVKEFPDTHRFMDAGSQLFIGNDGLVVIKRHEIWRVTIG